jgi:protease IV
MKTFWRVVGVLIFIIIVAPIILAGLGLMHILQPPEKPLVKDSILYLKLDGIILDTEEFMENLKQYRKEKDIKGIIVRIDSPGGVVAPSQELYEEFKRTREVFKKPIVVSGGALVASGAYYAAVGADKIVVNAGTMIGSIGVILEMINLEKLYEWAKVERYSLTTGAMKDAGAEYKPLSPEARRIFQDMIDEVYRQFVKAVSDNRKIDAQVLRDNTDGRVMSGERAVKLGFADQVGTFEDARKLIGELTGLGEEPDLYEPPKKRRNFEDFFIEATTRIRPEQALLEKWLKIKASGAPLFLLPGSLAF